MAPQHLRFDNEETPDDQPRAIPVEGEVIIDYAPPRDRPRASASARTASARYPMVYEVRYPGSMDRAAAALRPFFTLPLLVFLVPLNLMIAGGFVIGWLAVIATRSYPRWLFDALVSAIAFGARIEAYVLLLTDDFPLPNDPQSAVALVWADPPDGRLSPWRVFLWKAVILLPHAAFILAMAFVQLVVALIAWVTILRTGRHPRDLFAFSTGVNRWRYRVLGYFASFNDRFPPFSPWAGAGPAQPGTVMACAAVGLIAAGVLAGIGGAAVNTTGARSQPVFWADLERLTPADPGWRFVSGSAERPSFVVSLRGLGNAAAPAADNGLAVPRDARVVTFVLDYQNRTGVPLLVEAGTITAVVSDADGRRSEVAPAFATVGGLIIPEAIGAGRTGRVEATFFLAPGASIVELRLAPPWRSPKAVFRFY